jgi:hypothetical protein
MRKLLTIALVLALAGGAEATLQSQYTLSQDATFQQRVRQSLVSAAVAISNEAGSVAFHGQRVNLAARVLADPGFWSLRFSEGVASDSTVATAAGSPTPNQASVTDAQINNAVTSQWNAYAGAQ